MLAGGGGRGVVVRGGTGIPAGGVGARGAPAGAVAGPEKRDSTDAATAALPSAGVGRAVGGAMLKLPVGVFFAGGGARGAMVGTTLEERVGPTG